MRVRRVTDTETARYGLSYQLKKRLCQYHGNQIFEFMSQGPISGEETCKLWREQPHNDEVLASSVLGHIAEKSV